MIKWRCHGLRGFFCSEWLHEYVSNLLLSAYVLNVHPPVSNAFMNKMISHIYVLTSIVEDKILTECNSRLAVHLE
jgi:hypothetical protein